MSVFLKRHGKPINYIQASDLALGEIIHDGQHDYMVIRQANPDETLYDKSCDGTWFVATSVFNTSTWCPEPVSYPDTELIRYVDGCQEELSAGLRKAVKTVKIPYIKDFDNSTVESGDKGFETKLFILSAAEIGENAPTRDGVAIPAEIKNQLLNSSSGTEWTRSIMNSNNEPVVIVCSQEGTFEEMRFHTGYDPTYGFRPVFVLPYNARFNSETKTFQGVW